QVQIRGIDDQGHVIAHHHVGLGLGIIHGDALKKPGLRLYQPSHKLFINRPVSETNAHIIPGMEDVSSMSYGRNPQSYHNLPFTKDPDEIVETVVRLAPVFGGINLEDISAPRCFEIERKLKERLNIPVFHDDQHGTAIVLLAALINALKVVDKTIDDLKIVINGAGSAGTAIAKLLLLYGLKDITVCDSKGIVTVETARNEAKKELAMITNPRHLSGTLKDAMIGSDVFIGVSAANCVSEEMVQSMNRDPIVFAMANPVPEIMPEAAYHAGAKIVGTGRSDYPNQINNVLVFPGVFRGALDVRAREITENMKLAAAKAIASLISDEELKASYVIPSVFHPEAAKVVAKAVADVAIRDGIAQI
ncbi:MAG: NAD(P)-dependent malic enzyme, partial [bacterium]